MPVMNPSGLDAAATNPEQDVTDVRRIEEYASMRLTLVCVMAARFPSVSDAMATPAISISQSSRTGQKTVSKRRRSNAKLAVFEATLM